MLLEITDIGGGVIEIVYNDASSIMKSRLLRKGNIYDIQLMKDLSYVLLQGSDTVKISFQAISKVGSINSPASNQVLYDEIKAMMIV